VHRQQSRRPSNGPMDLGYMLITAHLPVGLMAVSIRNRVFLQKPMTLDGGAAPHREFLYVNGQEGFPFLLFTFDA
jgi:hypothetical protein